MDWEITRRKVPIISLYYLLYAWPELDCRFPWMLNCCFLLPLLKSCLFICKPFVEVYFNIVVLVFILLFPFLPLFLFVPFYPTPFAPSLLLFFLLLLFLCGFLPFLCVPSSFGSLKVLLHNPGRSWSCGNPSLLAFCLDFRFEPLCQT